VVDVSIDSVRGNPPPSLLRCRRRPSGCVIEELQSGYSKVPRDGGTVKP
jgi:homeobox-leucine zipper protein